MFNLRFIRLLFLLMVVSFWFCINVGFSFSDIQELDTDEAEAFIQELSAVLEKISSLQVDFQQERHHSLFIEPLVSKGVCFFKDPHQMRWEIYEPCASLLIFKDNSVAKYDFKEGVPRRLKLGSQEVIREVLAQIMGWIKGDFEGSAPIYDIRIFKKENYALRLIPRSEELLENIRFIELHFDKDTKHIVQVLIYETETDFVRIIFSNEANNLDLDDRLFDLNDPLFWNRKTKG